jgi:hypothetical protein
MLAAGGVTTTRVTVAVKTLRAAVPVTVPVTGMTPPARTVANTLTCPAATGDARPCPLTVAFVASDVDHVTELVISLDVPSENEPRASN